MSDRHQTPESSKSHHARSYLHGSDRRSPNSSSGLPRQPAPKRPKYDDLKNTATEAPSTVSQLSASRGQKAQSTRLGDTTPDEDVAANLESLLDEYDLGIDEETKRQSALEESRRRRQAILEKHLGSQAAARPGDSTAAAVAAPGEPKQALASHSYNHPKDTQEQTTSEPFSLSKSTSHDIVAAGEDGDHREQDLDRASAAELDPDADRAQELARLEQRRRAKLPTASSTSTTKGDAATTEQKEEFEEIEVTDDEDDGEVDMFALSDGDDEAHARKKRTKTIRVPTRGTSKAAFHSNAATVPVPEAAAATKTSANLASNWDDSEGYLRTILGETLDERYQVFAVLGKGMFASVVRARDLRDEGREVAIKIIRVQESMYSAGLKEAAILHKLNDSDPEDRKHVVRLERHFDYKGHLCMVFESLGMNLRDVVRRYGRDVGLNMQAVRAYAHQLFLALSHLAKNQVVHADIKPDNVLVNDNKTLLKLCDLGSATFLSEMEITPYLVSRFYRAPEIILGQTYDCAIDVWSTGCTLYELATGKILLPGRTNNHMLLLMQELRGRFTAKQLRKSQFGEQHFDETNAFLSVETDKSTGQNLVRKVMLHKPTLDLRSRLLPGSTTKQLRPSELKVMNQFVDLLERCLELDPAKRIKPKDALEHPFLAHV